MLKSVSEIRVNKKSIRKTAMDFGIPYQTLRNRRRGHNAPDNFGKETLFTEEERLGLVDVTDMIQRFGYGVSNAALQKYSGEIAFRFGRRPVDKPISTCWLYRFLQRWQSRVVSKKPSALESNRAKTSTTERVE
ncbi:hypothetical protein DPMN_089695 [Dreissena polymorpha]|uniref:HTH CENPB-type domain-containing protein n=1 Tax=Dreissena polymorpha TaxID=45954 RepID=A0A9D4KXA1_DREPO|nr:hypothetical protein DPMN_089695 [Dreissena polymorpha]